MHCSWGRCGQGRGPATSGCWQAGAAVRPPSLSSVHQFRLPLCSQSRDIMEAVCKVARTTQYRNTSGAPGVSTEKNVGLCVLPWLWRVLRPSQAEGICAYACMDRPPFLHPCPPSSLSLSLFLSFHLSLLSPNGCYGCLSGNCAVGGVRLNALACEWVDMWPQKTYTAYVSCSSDTPSYFTLASEWTSRVPSWSPDIVLPFLCVCVCCYGD